MRRTILNSYDRFHRGISRPFFSRDRISHFDVFDRSAPFPASTNNRVLTKRIKLGTQQKSSTLSKNAHRQGMHSIGRYVAISLSSELLSPKSSETLTTRISSHDSHSTQQQSSFSARISALSTRAFHTPPPPLSPSRTLRPTPTTQPIDSPIPSSTHKS